jgi:Spy/CpxP family protein refolding chaperone
MKKSWFIIALAVTVAGLFLVSGLSTTVTADSETTEQVQKAQKTTPSTPEAVSPKDPDTQVPFPSMICPYCGREIPGRCLKGPNARPRLGAGRADRNFPRAGREGMADLGRKGRGPLHHPGRRGGDRFCGAGRLGMLLRQADILGLTEDQQVKLKALHFSAEKEMIDLRAALQKERLEIRQLMQSEDVDARNIKRQLEAVAQARTNLEFRRISLWLEARDVLTAEQREMIKQKLRGFGGPPPMEEMEEE